MQCAHCRVAFHESWDTRPIHYQGHLIGWLCRITRCPACSEFIIEVAQHENDWEEPDWRMIHPVGANRGPVPPEVPPDVAIDYAEACNVLPISAKASAALARRCLQNVMRRAGYLDRDLSKQIDAFVGESDPSKVAPLSIRETIDAIRNFGNFSAHPINDITSLQIIDVEPNEAEWCLDILEDLFQHLYVEPEISKRRKAALNAKLAAAGKPASK